MPQAVQLGGAGSLLAPCALPARGARCCVIIAPLLGFWIINYYLGKERRGFRRLSARDRPSHGESVGAALCGLAHAAALPWKGEPGIYFGIFWSGIFLFRGILLTDWCSAAVEDLNGPYG